MPTVLHAVRWQRPLPRNSSEACTASLGNARAGPPETKPLHLLQRLHHRTTGGRYGELAQQIVELWDALDLEAQGWKHCLDTVATALHSVHPALNAETAAREDAIRQIQTALCDEASLRGNMQSQLQTVVEELRIETTTNLELLRSEVAEARRQLQGDPLALTTKRPAVSAPSPICTVEDAGADQPGTSVNILRETQENNFGIAESMKVQEGVVHLETGTISRAACEHVVKEHLQFEAAGSAVGEVQVSDAAQRQSCARSGSEMAIRISRMEDKGEEQRVALKAILNIVQGSAFALQNIHCDLDVEKSKRVSSEEELAASVRRCEQQSDKWCEELKAAVCGISVATDARVDRALQDLNEEAAASAQRVLNVERMFAASIGTLEAASLELHSRLEAALGDAEAAAAERTDASAQILVEMSDMMRAAEDRYAIHVHKDDVAEACACSDLKILQQQQPKVAVATDVDSTIRALHEEASAERYRCLCMYSEVLAKMDQCEKASEVRHSELEALVLDVGSTANAAVRSTASHRTAERQDQSSTGEAFGACMGNLRTRLQPADTESSFVCTSPLPRLDLQNSFDQAALPQPFSPLSWISPRAPKA
eukprot:CAMPEP_0172877836 /NCGR_PEP_ID=MMETSP1075-20121228/108052_1 /TAXON_ID=2916 /ORGANISM="Ceratium fusus, Strain PA161109" /LENGTH=598 /DNA_ID=CAMNT_0013729481 /DNA_START=47 /DNA_END=1839 /DNA_ORIENTATION=+